MSEHYLKRLFEPRHVALLGMSRNPAKAGHRLLQTLRRDGFRGEISLLGTEDGEIDGCRMYSDPSLLPAGIDLAFNLLNPARTPDILPLVAARGVAFTVVFTSGFAEMGGEAAVAQQLMVETCRRHGMRIVGPNCPGMFNLPFGLNLTSARTPAGRVALVSQSGNVGITLWDRAPFLDTGFSVFIGFGNQADIPAHDYIDYLGDDSATSVIAVYLEGLKDGTGDAFLEACARTARKKPIVALKGGRSDAGRRAAESHTASLSSTERVFSAFFEEAGIVEVHHLEHLLPVAQTLMLCPPMRGDSVAIVGSGGGHSTVFTDEISAAGFDVPVFSDDVQATLRDQLPAWAPVRNPVDMTGAYTSNPGLFASMTELVMTGSVPFDGAVNYGLYGLWRDGAVDPSSPHSYATAAPLLGQLQKKLGKPIIFYTPYANRSHESFTAMRESGVPCFDDMQVASLALAALRTRHRFLARDDATRPAAILPQAKTTDTPPHDLDTEIGAYRFLRRFGVRTPEVRGAATGEEAVQAASEIGYPVVVKAVMPGIAHKSDAGGVRTDLGSPEEVRQAVADIGSSVAAARGAGALSGFMVMPDLGRRREFFVGVRRDRAFSALGVLGLGGVMVEILDDVAICPLPATPERVARAIDRLATAGFWRDARGSAGVSPQAVADLLNRLHAAMMSDPGIASVECNPTMLVDGHLVPVDAVIAR